MFDTAGCLRVITIQAGREVERKEVPCTSADLSQRAGQIADLGVNLLICGAVSQELAAMVTLRGIPVISHVCGDVEEVLGSYLAGQALQDHFGMPGCCGRRGRGAGRGGCGGRGRRWQGQGA